MNSESTDPQGRLEHTVGRMRDAVAHSHNFATAKKDIGPTEREHSLWLCARLAEAIGEIERLQSTACPMNGGRWWRVFAPDGSVWCETSNASEARERMRPGDSLYRQYVGECAEWRHIAGPELPPNP